VGSPVGHRVCTRLCDVLVLLRGIPTHSDRSDDLAAVDDRDASLEGCRTREPERCDATVLDLVLEDFARAPEDGRRSTGAGEAASAAHSTESVEMPIPVRELERSRRYVYGRGPYATRPQGGSAMSSVR